MSEGQSWSEIADSYDELLVAGSGPHETALACTLRLLGKLEHRFLTQRLGHDLVVASRAGTPLETKTIMRRAVKAWTTDRVAAGLEALAGVTLHEARHTYASMMIAAGVGAKDLSEFMGHSSINVTIDHYGHLFPGSRQQAARMLDAYLADA